MLEDLRKKSIKTTKIWLLILIICAVALFGIMGSTFSKLFSGPKSLDHVTVEDIPGVYVKGDITAIYGQFAEYYEEDEYGHQTITDNYYIIPLGKKYIGLHVSPEDFEGADQIFNETMDFLDGNADDIYTRMSIIGTINPMPSEAYDYFEDFFSSFGYTDEEIEELALPYMLDIGYVGEYESYVVYGLLTLGAVLILLSIICIIQMFTGAHLSKIKKFIKHNQDSVGMESIEADYERGAVLGSFVIGKLFTFYFRVNKANILKNSDMVWAYLLNVTHRSYGIKVGVTRSLIIYTKDKKKHTIQLKKNDDINAILNRLAEVNPHIITGYSDDLLKLFKKDFDTFVNLRYNRETATAQAPANEMNHTY